MNISNRSSEKWLERTAAEWVNTCGGFCVKLIASTVTGLPDRLILWPGGVAEFVEFKSSGKRPGPMQRIIRTRIEYLGFRYTVIDDEQTLKQWQFLNRDRINAR